MEIKQDLQYHFNQYKNSSIYAVLGEPQSKGRSNLEVTKALLAGGIKVIQYRDKEKSVKAKFEECQAIRALTAEAGATFIVNDSVELALACRADGLHVGQKDLPIEIVRSLVPNYMLLGLSINTLEQWKKAVMDNIAHYIGVGPVFPTRTKLDTSPQIDVALEREAIAGDEILPAVAISGINKENIPELRKRGFKRFAMVSELVGAEDIVSHTKKLLTL